jgi:Cft2 family RNA processing exonuclease
MVFSTIANSYLDEFPFRKKKKILRASGYFFLSHAHADHTVGIKSTLSSPDSTIVCSEATSAALKILYRIPKEKCLIIEPGQSLDFDSFVVHALDANHCLGSLMFAIESPNNEKEVYTGDFRLGKPILDEFELLQNANLLWMDYTYGNKPRYNFPSRETLISEILTLILSEWNDSDKEVWIAAYQIGKERLLKTISDALNVKIWAPEEKVRIYEEIGKGWDIFTNESDSRVFVGSRRIVENLTGLDKENKTRLVDSMRISPTGWAIDLATKRLDVHYFPYSDHCSNKEVHEFIDLVKAQEIKKI